MVGARKGGGEVRVGVGIHVGDGDSSGWWALVVCWWGVIVVHGVVAVVPLLCGVGLVVWLRNHRCGTPIRVCHLSRLVVSVIVVPHSSQGLGHSLSRESLSMWHTWMGVPHQPFGGGCRGRRLHRWLC